MGLTQFDFDQADDSEYASQVELDQVKDNNAGPAEFVALTMNNWELWKRIQGLSAWTDTANPTPNNDGVDTAALGRIFSVGEFWTNTAQDSFWVCVDNTTGAAVWYLLDPGVVTNEPTGFPNITDSTVAFDDGTLTLSVAPVSGSFDIYTKGIRTGFSSTQTATITDTEGRWYFYFDKDTYVLTTTQTFSLDIIISHVYVANLYWDATNNTAISLGEERHAFMPGVTHIIIHNALHTQYFSGLGLNGFVVDGDGSLDTHAQFGSEAGVIADEDLIFNIAADTTPGTYPIFYRDGANGDWRKDAADSFPLKNFVGGSGLAAYNQWTGATWQQTEVGEGNYSLSIVAATNDVNQPIVVFQGREVYESVSYATLFARTEAFNILSDENNLPFAELRMIGAVIYQTSTGYTNTVLSRVVSTAAGDDYVDLRDAVLLAGDVLRLRTVGMPAQASSSAIYGGRPGVKMTTNASNTFGIAFPAEAVEIVGVCIIATGEATVSGVDIDLTSTYNALNESLTEHVETDNVSIYDFVADVLVELNISSVFTQASAGDSGGVLINHNSIGTSAYYFYFRIDYLAY